jgi:hypothetical protein
LHKKGLLVIVNNITQYEQSDQFSLTSSHCTKQQQQKQTNKQTNKHTNKQTKQNKNTTNTKY